MSYRVILLHLDTYPDIVPTEAIDQAVALCAALGGSVTATGFQVRIPLTSNFIADRLLRLGDVARAEEARSQDNLREVFARFEAQAAAASLVHQTLPLDADYYDRPEHLARAARSHDLCVVPYTGEIPAQTALAEALVFGSGRPVVIFRAGPGEQPPRALRRVLIAWDGGRAGARAVADAMPALTQADEVRVLTVLDDKPSTTAGQAGDLLRHLEAHGVVAQAEEFTRADRTIAEVLEQAAWERGFDLLVMGAFGHARLREFVLGGATQSLMTTPPIPILLSH
ncbi:MAG: universal stress protein [Caulobacter sp.]|nr:universal stress protein [Caulobacter sp.]